MFPQPPWRGWGGGLQNCNTLPRILRPVQLEEMTAVTVQLLIVFMILGHPRGLGR